jgi:exonuclease III
LEEFLASNHLYVINGDNEITIFQSSRGKSNIDLTIANNQMLADVTNRDISEEESASDHNIIKFNIRLDEHTIHRNKPSGPRYRIKEHILIKFNEKLHSNIAKTYLMGEKERTKNEIDEEMSRQVKENTDIQQFTVKLEEVIQTK